MELGTGIFVSSLFLGTVALFLFTKDRWNWKKVSLYVFGLPFTVILIGGGGYYVYYQYEQRPTAQTEYMGLKLGMSKEDVLARWGLPRVFKTPDPRPTIKETKPPKAPPLERTWLKVNTSDEALSVDEWVHPSYSWRLNFLDGSLSQITNFSEGGSILGLSVGGYHYQIINKLGEPETSRDIERGNTYRRHYYYKTLNLEIVVEEGRIKAIAVRNTWPLGLSTME